MPEIYTPQHVEQISDNPDEEISWLNQDTKWRTARELVHISNPATGDLTDRTYSLVFTNLGIPPISVTGIELAVSAQRNGRIFEDIVQLTYNGEPIGINNFNYDSDTEGHLAITNDTLYGSPTDLWGTELTPEIVSDPSFGFILKYQSHPYYPHRQGMLLYSAKLIVYSEVVDC